MGCYINTLEIGCYSSCNVLTLTNTATQNGFHRIKYDGSNGVWTELVSLTIGQNIVIDTTQLNESDCIYINIQQPDGTLFDFSGYDSLKIKTIIENEI